MNYLSKKSKSNDEISKFLENIKSLIKEGNVDFNIRPWKLKVNKTLKYMTEKNISTKDISEALLELEVGDFCYVEDDRNSFFRGEFWFFTRDYCLVDKVESMYIKIKLFDYEDKKVLVMSFHPQQPANDKDYLVPQRYK
ncbi:hypothetical protein HMPREF0979_01869 [Coprobacillus sp. 8_1_38FAA]|nr:hypothetical protein HMPREF0979_01869 [Coprobacillus sp. 8_1_38FAA]